MSSTYYWLVIIFLIIAIVGGLVYIFMIWKNPVDCCYNDDKSCCKYLSPEPAGCRCHSSPCHCYFEDNKCDNNREFYAMVVCLGVILAIMIMVFILFIYLSPSKINKAETRAAATGAAVVDFSPRKVDPTGTMHPYPKFKPEFVPLPPPIMPLPKPEDYVRLGSLGCKKRSSCRKAPTFRVVVDD